MTNATEFRNIIANLPDFPGGEISFYLLTTFATAGTEGFPKKAYSLTLDAYGQGTQPLPVPPSGAWEYRVGMPDGKPHYPTLAAGADLQLTTWLASAQSTVAAASLVDQFAALTDFDAHVADTTAVHGIADTSALETTAGAQAKADAVASDLADHEAATGTAVHGLGSAAVEDSSAFDAAGSAAAALASALAADDLTEYIIVALSDETSDLETGAAKATFTMPYAMTLTAVSANVATAPTGSAIQIGINEAGVSILSTDLTIDATETSSATAAVPAVISDANLAAGAVITMDLDAVGSSVAGAGLKVTMTGTRIP